MNNRKNDLAVVLLAGGQSTRMMTDTPKQFMRVAGKTIIEHSFSTLSQCIPHGQFVVVAPPDAIDYTARLLGSAGNLTIVPGGGSRQESVFNALSHLRGIAPDRVLIHDAARPFVSCKTIQDVLAALEEYEAVDVAIPTADTIIVERDGFIQSIPKRTHILRGQTPQGFRFSALQAAYEEIGNSRLGEFTDDCGIYLAANPLGRVRIVLGSTENIKITDAIDLVLADELFRMRAAKLDFDHQGIEVKDKKALVFGGGRGIGRAIANILKDAQCDVHIASKSSGCDVSDYSQVETTVRVAQESLGRIDYVVNCVGFLAKQKLHLQEIGELNNLVATNFVGALNIAKASYKPLRESQGMLLNLSSSSYTRGRAGYTPYSASKAAIVNLTQGLSEEWEPEKIRVNCIVPGRTDTEMRRKQFDNECQAQLTNPYEVALSACRLLSSGQTGLIVRP